MDDEAVLQHLATIRMLMERSALYRRAMGPVMLLVGATGLAAGVLGAMLDFHPPLPVIGYWLAVAAICMTEASWLIRLQALRQREPFWSPPMRRVTQAVLPAFAAGLVTALPFAFLDVEANHIVLLVIPSWMVFYGLAMHAAGFFMPRSFKILGWSYVLLGTLVFAGLLTLLNAPDSGFRVSNLGVRLGTGSLSGVVHLVMGFLFGVVHLAYGFFLYFTEKRGNAP